MSISAPIFGLLAGVLSLFVQSQGPSRADPGGRPVALELVLALDASTSVSIQEFVLQTAGLAAAFRDPAVLTAIEALGEEGLAVTLVQWADADEQVMSVDWTWVADPASADAFASRVAAVSREARGGTVISEALAFALAALDGNAFEGRRRVIDVSGDGPDIHSVATGRERDRAVARGVTINGLAIESHDPRLADYYRYAVIGGPAAFVVTANSFEAYREAMTGKLVREISGGEIAWQSESGLEDFAGVHQPLGIERLLDGPHEALLLGRDMAGQGRALLPADPMFGRE